MSRNAKRLRMWGTCTVVTTRHGRVHTACMRVQRITPSTGVIARVHISLSISSGLTSILSSNLLNPYTDRPLDIVMHMTRPSSSTCLMPREACSCQMTHTGVFPCFQLALSA